ncbi:hypothetical protein EOL94_00245 [bacterium]|nr:hypothetical protein [bacterium]
MRKRGTITLVWIVVIMIASGFIIMQSRAKQGDVVDNFVKEKTSIATCPTYYEIANLLDKNEYEIIKTDSSSESFNLLRSRDVEYVLSGRPPKPNERDFEKEFITKNGYSFIGTQEKVINKDDLKNETICTDLDKERVVLEFNLQKVDIVEEIADCPSNSIIITSWGNTDYSRFNVVHIVNEDESRHILSRTPILYCLNDCPQNIINQIKKIYEK